MYISYSGFDTYLECRKQYDLQYVLKTPKPKADNRVHMLYGDTVGKIVEAFYTDKLWERDPLGRMLALVRPTMDRIIAKETQRGGQFDWNAADLKDDTRSREAVEQSVIDTIPNALRSIKRNRLLGTFAQAEMKLDLEMDGHLIAGRADFVMRRVKPHGDLVIIDGKGSRHRHKYTNHRQLRWYAMLYWMRHGLVPDKLGFLYWRFEPHENLDWSTVTVPELEALKRSVLETATEIEQASKELVQLGPKANRAQVFLPHPGNHCKLCDYLPLCPDGKKALAKSTKSLIAEDSEAGVEDGGVSF